VAHNLIGHGQASKALLQFADTGNPAKLSVLNHERVRRILLALNEAAEPKALDLPGFKFHALKGNQKGRYSVWVTGNWRVTFAFDGEDAIGVDLEDYHA
jgi:toxin HigB-1